MYIYDDVVILSSMWYVLRFEHAHGLKRYNNVLLMDKRPVVLEVHSYNFYCRFPKSDCSFDGLLTLLRNSGRHSKSSVIAVAIFLLLAIKSTLITVPCNRTVPRLYNNSDASFRLLISDDINPNPGLVSASTAGKINCRVMNARSLKS